MDDEDTEGPDEDEKYDSFMYSEDEADQVSMGSPRDRGTTTGSRSPHTGGGGSAQDILEDQMMMEEVGRVAIAAAEVAGSEIDMELVDALVQNEDMYADEDEDQAESQQQQRPRESSSIRFLSRESRADSFSQRAMQRVQVVVRLRPYLAHDDRRAPQLVHVTPEQNSVQITDHSSFTFDAVHGMGSSQREIYDRSARSLVASCLEGYNATIFAYGQTGTGKTYTMEGDAERFEDRGVVPRAIEQIFSHIQEKASGGNRFLVRASYLQIYNDVIYDLLKPENANLQIREDDRSKENTRGVYVEGLSEWVVRSPAEIFKLMSRGAAGRATGKTKLNEVSSRSHAILKIIVEQCETTFVDLQGRSISSEQFEKMLIANAFGDKSPEDLVRQRFRIAKLNLVDLAGSERVRISGATGQRLEESRKINRSLSALGNVISALTDDRGRQHIPYRDSKLTRILEDSLGGNCKTAMYAMISPAGDAISETLSTLKFANRAKSIRNKACVNEDVDKNSLLRKYERELKRLRRELAQKSKNVVDQRVVLELEDQKRRAEADKMAALRALESRSVEFMREKEAKRQLEERIAQLQSKMLMGGPGSIHLSNVQDTPQFRTALKAHRDQMRAEYSAKVEDLEREREQIEVQLAQTDRYKQLLLKQRDIMVNLTQRLNERDDQIIALQDELDESEKKRRDTEERLDEKTTELIHLKRLALESQHATPGADEKSRELRQALGVNPDPDSSYVEDNKIVTFAQQQKDKVLTLAVGAEADHGLGVTQGQDRNADQSSARPRSASSLSKEMDFRTGKSEGAEANARLEQRVRALTEQYQTFREQMTARVAKRDNQLRSVREENAKMRVQLENMAKERQEMQSALASAKSAQYASGTPRTPKSPRARLPSGDNESLLVEMEKLRQRSINHAKEQLAMQTIMDKIKSIVVQVRSQSEELPEGVNKDLTGLFNLVTRCLQALAIKETHAATSSSSSK
ncbi:Kinesin-like protein [Hondaea fermentalgiana]|uniref:Kinesin-like protein n=1 Tax=Hondaea fermentalgiana TaxID=2315210 RepID=A0A2R5G2E0_9STRA|nr:Kinesin-like protein [Hondaea fermentalgiana]|eukprot:GBG25162.1 Kinesin-like protein [Hondaea fermentalgiana]